MALSGSLVMMENNMSSDLLCSFFENSFNLFRFLISMSMIIPPKFNYKNCVDRVEIGHGFIIYIKYKVFWKK